MLVAAPTVTQCVIAVAFRCGAAGADQLIEWIIAVADGLLGDPVVDGVVAVGGTLPF